MKIFPKLLISFLLIALFPLGGFVLFTYKSFVGVAIRQQINDFVEIAEERIAFISRYFDNLEKIAILMAHSENVTRNLYQLSKIYESKGGDSTEYKEELAKSHDFLSIFSNTYNLEDLYFVNLKGDVVFSYTQQSDFGKNVFTSNLRNTQFATTISNVFSQLSSYISNYAYYEPSQKETIFIGAPVFNNKKLIGAFIFQLPPNVINKLFSNYANLGRTGEALIGVKQENSAIFVNKIRHFQDSAFKLKIPLGSDIAIPLQQAVQGDRGIGESVDYRGEKILAVWDYFPELEWGIVVKLDLKEVLAPVYQLRNIIIIITLVSILVVFIIAIFTAKNFSKPIIALQQDINQLGEGKLEFQMSINRRDEIGSLAKSFHEMIEKLKVKVTSISNLKEEIKQRKEAEQAKSEFISVISHELRTPIGPIQESINLVLEEIFGQLNEKQKEILTISKNNTKRLSDLINDILDFQKIEANQMEYNMKLINVNELLQEVVHSFQILAEKKGIELMLHLEPHALYALIDRTRMIQVITNLISNAVKFTDRGIVKIYSSVKDNKIEIAIQDSGPGIKEENKGKLFQSFRQLNIKSDKKKQGSGLGLIISKKIIEAHGGRLNFTSKENEGSTFYFTLPVKQEGINEQENSDH